MLRIFLLTLWCRFDNWRKRNNGFYKITSMPSDWYEGHWFSGPGWYWADECEQLNGPHATRREARDALEYYIFYEL